MDKFLSSGSLKSGNARVLQGVSRNSKSAQDRGTAPRAELATKGRGNRRGHGRRQKREMSNINSRSGRAVRPAARVSKGRARRCAHRGEGRRDSRGHGSHNAETPGRATRRIVAAYNNAPGVLK